jgi:flavin reductase (DIM6/NTAB) family NADH-FMN oxidoreductase RutF
MDRDAVSPALGKLPSGLYIATALADGVPVGMLASFIEQAGFEPPMVTVALGRERAVARALEAGSALGLNVLGESDGALMKPFVKPGERSPFDGLEFDLDRGRAPRLAQALAFLHCELRGHVDAGDHRVYLCEVVSGVLQKSEDKPMVRVRRDGFNY